ncbi:LysR family transcriptional regulator [Achromobacter sp. Root83]|uniref:LysR family transcriptional regulator n=1 Tax=Achromobacter sp. Root83 TaxID=1736602 RepID=UPI00070B65E1|nr:LysR family transcriptional regulator [Achromobacter sp. Root83]KRC83330.1 LysR family transcriptional regulator [Achromobacter sp. Root83]
MNPTFKQLEAFYYSATLGSLSSAATALHATQSAISKRVSDLEAELGRRLLHRGAAGIALTPDGERLLPLAEEALRLRLRMAEGVGGAVRLEGRVRIGVTELTALSWLGMLISTLAKESPGLTLEPSVAPGLQLIDQLRQHELDLAIVPGNYWGDEFRLLRVGVVENVWMASPSAGVPEGPLKPADFAQYPFLEQSHDSSKSLFYRPWLEEHGFRFNRVFASNSLAVLGELTVDGFGISQLCPAYFRPELDAGLLKIIRSDPMPPPMIYNAVFHQGTLDARNEHIARRAAELCDFSRRRNHPVGGVVR